MSLIQDFDKLSPEQARNRLLFYATLGANVQEWLKPRVGFDYLELASAIDDLKKSAAQQNIATTNFNLVIGNELSPYVIRKTDGSPISVWLNGNAKLRVRINLDPNDSRFTNLGDAALVAALQEVPLALDLKVETQTSVLEITVLDATATPIAGSLFLNFSQELYHFQNWGTVVYWADEERPALFHTWFVGMSIGFCLADEHEFSHAIVGTKNPVPLSIYGRGMIKDNITALMHHKPWTGKLNIKVNDPKLQVAFTVLAAVYDHFGGVVTITQKELINLLLRARGLSTKEVKSCLNSLAPAIDAGFIAAENVGEEVVYHALDRLVSIAG